MHDGATVVFARDVARGEDGDHPVDGQDRVAVDALADQLAVRHGRQQQRRKQGATHFRNVVGVGRLARDVQQRRFMGKLAALFTEGQQFFQ